jgi:hypothetical protein
MNRPKAAITAAALALWCGCGWANDSFGSEISHVFAGMGVASAVTAIADHYGAEDNRGWIGFGTAVGLSFVAEAAQVVSNGSSQLKGSSLDFASALVGAAVGAWVTDRYLLAPVVAKDAEGHRIVGIVMRMPF